MEQSLTWMKLWIENDEKPPGRYNHTITGPLVCAPRKTVFLRQSSSGWNKRACSMWMFGGINDSGSYLNDLWELHFPNADGIFDLTIIEQQIYNELTVFLHRK